MEVVSATLGKSTNLFPNRRDRAADLIPRYPHAAEMLRLYQRLALLQFGAYEAAYARSLALDEIPDFVVKWVPAVVDATVALGPARLRDGIISVFCTADLKALIRRWLDQETLNPFETYLARASAGPMLEEVICSLTQKFPPRLAGEGQAGGSTCPACGGLPQLSYFAVSGEALVSGPRYLVCSRCATNWIFSRMMCASCGESNGTKLPIYQEQEQFPHARVDGCQTCRKYLLTFDLRRDTRAVPIVDEIASLPLDLYARDQGLTKITPNLMGN